MATTITVSYSELDTYRQCPLKHLLGYGQLWTKEQGEGSALARGTAWHLILETHYLVIKRMRTKPDGTWLRHPSRAKTAEILWACGQEVGPLLAEPDGEQTEQQVLLEWMYTGHVEAYGIDEDWQILEVEYAGQTRLLTERGGRSRFMLKYKADLVIKDLMTNQIKIVDHKSASNFSRQNEIDIADQFGLYSWAFRQPGQPLDSLSAISIIRSDARTQRNKGPMKLEDRFRRVQTFRSDKELANIALDAYRTAKAAYSPNSQVYSSPNPQECGWKCDFLEVHIAARKGIAPMPVVLRDFGFHQREAKHQQYTKQEGQD